MAKKKIPAVLIVSLLTLFFSFLTLIILLNLIQYAGLSFAKFFNKDKSSEQHLLEPEIIKGWQFIPPVGNHTSLYSFDIVADSDSSNGLWGVAGGTSGVLNYYNNGVWTEGILDANGAVTGIDLFDRNRGRLTVSGSGPSKIFRFNGSDWLLEKEFENFFITDISGDWACGSAGSIFHYTDGVWTESPAPLPGVGGRPSDWLFAIDMFSSNSGAACATSYMLTFKNGTWKPQAMVELADPNNTTSLLSHCFMKDVDMVGEDDGWAVGACKQRITLQDPWEDYGAVYRLVDGSWQEQARFPSSLLSISMASKTKGWAVGDKCTIAMYDGKNWQIQECPIPDDSRFRNLKDNLQVVKAVNEKEAWALGRWSIKLYYNEDGAPVQPKPTPTPKPSPNGFWLPFLQPV
jgi:hypothetical protein